MRLNKKGFTLIELLVVISIIALLLAILMPALTKVKDMARALSCASNQRQLAVATFTYASSNDGEWPFFNTASDGVWGLDNEFWFNHISPYVGIEDKDEDGDGIKDGMLNADIRKCANYTTKNPAWIAVNYGYSPDKNSPAAPFFYGEFRAGFNGPVTHRYPPLKLSGVKNASGWICFMDGQWQIVYTPAHWTFAYDHYKDDSVPMDSHADTHILNGASPKRHSDGMNIALMDGHVEKMSFEEIWDVKAGSDGRYEVTHNYWYNK